MASATPVALQPLLALGLGQSPAAFQRRLDEIETLVDAVAAELDV